MPQISPYAIVDETAELADDVRVGAFSYIGPHVRIGPGCAIHNNATVTGRTTLGAKSEVFPMAVIGIAADPSQGPGECTIGQANFIREHVTIYGGTDRPTQLGIDNLIMISSQIGPGATVGDHEIFANLSVVGAGAVVEDYVRTSGFTTVFPNVRVGAYAMIAGYTGIDRDAPPFSMVQGYPFRVRGVNTENLRRCAFGEDDIRALKRVFRDLFNGTGGEANARALKKLTKKPSANPHIRRLVEAVQRGAEAPREPHD